MRSLTLRRSVAFVCIIAVVAGAFAPGAASLVALLVPMFWIGSLVPTVRPARLFVAATPSPCACLSFAQGLRAPPSSL